jgi:hypothetical protein
MEQDPDKMPQKWLEQIWGFLQYVTQLYTSLTSFLIGFHMTIDSRRPSWDHEGWCLAQLLWQQMQKEDEDWSREVPVMVKAVSRFKDGIEVLAHLIKAENPPLKQARCKRTAKAFYGFGDASGSSFGALQWSKVFGGGHQREVLKLAGTQQSC